MKKLGTLERATILNLNDRQWEVLRDLVYFQDWVTPQLVGGTDQSHHSRTLMQLVKLQLAETKKRHAVYCWYGTREIFDALTGRIKRVRKPIQTCCCKGARMFRALP